MTKHTPTPWNIVTEKNYSSIENYEEDVQICKIPLFGEGKADAEFIVRAVNSHEALAAALRDLTSWFKYAKKHGYENARELNPVYLEQAQAALAKAKGE